MFQSLQLSRLQERVALGTATGTVPDKHLDSTRLEEGVREHELEHTSALRRVRGGVPAKNGELLHGPRPLLRGGVRLLRVQEASHQILHMQARAAGVLRLQQLGHRARARQLVEAAPTKSLQSRRHRHPRLQQARESWTVRGLESWRASSEKVSRELAVLVAVETDKGPSQGTHTEEGEGEGLQATEQPCARAFVHNKL